MIERRSAKNPWTTKAAKGHESREKWRSPPFAAFALISRFSRSKDLRDWGLPRQLGRVPLQSLQPLQAGDFSAVVMDVAKKNVQGETNVLHAQPNEG